MKVGKIPAFLELQKTGMPIVWQQQELLSQAIAVGKSGVRLITISKMMSSQLVLQTRCQQLNTSNLSRQSTVNPNQGGRFDRSIGGRGDRKCTLDFLSYYILILHSNQPNIISNESWHLHLPVECLKTILCCLVLP